MKKSELVNRMFDYLIQSDIRKPVAIPKQTLTVTDDFGHSKCFTFKKQDRRYHYTARDIQNILNSFIEVACNAVQRGESVYLPKVGAISPQFRKEHKVRIPGTQKFKSIPAHYVPKIKFSQAMKDAARVYEAYLADLLDSGQGDGMEIPEALRGRGRRTGNNINDIIFDDEDPTMFGEELDDNLYYNGDEDFDDEEDSDDDIDIEDDSEVDVELDDTEVTDGAV